MRQVLLALASGLVFGLGLVLSGMINPAKVLNFLDLAGTWDPSLACVMAGAIPVAAVGFWLRRPALTNGRIDARLVGGAALFGIGWGLVGYCPGPAIAGLGFGLWQTGLFVLAMLAGMAGAKIVIRRRLAVRAAI